MGWRDSFSESGHCWSRGVTGEHAHGTEEGFTLIELMVVLLVMGILLAIAIPTFLSVTGGAKKTGVQSDLTNTVLSAAAIYASSGSNAFPTLGSVTPPSGLLGTLERVQTTIHFTTGDIPTSTGGRNVVSVARESGTVVVFAALDGTDHCWAIGDSHSGSTSPDGVPPGNTFGAYLTTRSVCSAAAFLTSTPTAGGGWKDNFTTVPEQT